MQPKKKAKKRMFLSIALVVAIGLIMALVPPYLKLQELQEEQDRLQAQLVEIRTKKAKLEEYKQHLMSDAYIEQVARQELGLVRAGEVVFIRAKPGNALPLEKSASGYTDDIRD